MFASRDVCIHFGKKTWSHLRVTPDYLYKVFTRHLNMECFESAVPAIFLSYAPTFFEDTVSKPILNKTGCVRLVEIPDKDFLHSRPSCSL